MRWWTWVGLVIVGCGSSGRAERRGPQPPPAAECPAAQCPRADADPRPDLIIFAIDVGQGDATLVLGPFENGRRKAMLIDAGGMGPGTPDGGRVVVDLLDRLEVPTLDYVVLTHYDPAHLGGFVTVRDTASVLWTTERGSDECSPTHWFPSEAVFDNGPPAHESEATAEWEQCIYTFTATDTELVRVRDGEFIGDRVSLGGDVSARIVAGGGYVLGRQGPVENASSADERSIAVLVSSGGDFDFLVTGDLVGRPHGSEDARLEEALAEGLRAEGVDLEVLRTGHHGAASATAPGFVYALRPEVAVISVGDGSSPGHPHCDAVDALADNGVEMLVQTGAGATSCDIGEMKRVVAGGTIRIEVRGRRYIITPAAFHYSCASSGCESEAAPPSD